eukprot:gene26008-biopygen12870
MINSCHEENRAGIEPVVPAPGSSSNILISRFLSSARKHQVTARGLGAF